MSIKGTHYHLVIRFPWITIATITTPSHLCWDSLGSRSLIVGSLCVNHSCLTLALSYPGDLDSVKTLNPLAVRHLHYQGCPFGRVLPRLLGRSLSGGLTPYVQLRFAPSKSKVTISFSKKRSPEAHLWWARPGVSLAYLWWALFTRLLAKVLFTRGRERATGNGQRSWCNFSITPGNLGFGQRFCVIWGLFLGIFPGLIEKLQFSLSSQVCHFFSLIFNSEIYANFSSNDHWAIHC